MALVNIAKDDIKPLFIDPSDITALQIADSGTEIIICSGQGRILYANPQEWNLDVADVAQKLKNSGVTLLPFTMQHLGKEYTHYIAPGAVTFATVSLPGKNGRVGAIIGVKGVGRIETWAGDTTQSEIDNLIDAVRKTKTLFEYKPEEANARWHDSAALYIDPASVVRMEGSLDYSQINITFDNSSELDVQVANRGEFNPKTGFEQKAINIYNEKKYTGPHQGIDAVNDIVDQLKKEVFQARVAFVNKIAAANGNLLNISTKKQAAFLRKEDIRMVTFYTEKVDGAHVLSVRLKETHEGDLGNPLSLRFNTEAERRTILAVLSQSNAPRTKSKKRDLKL